MRIRVSRLVYALTGAALAAGLVTSAFVRANSTLAASGDCYGPCPSVTTLALSKSTVAYGNEQTEKFSVQVSPVAGGSGVPTGYVAVKTGTKILCKLHLSLGKGSCSPAPKALAPGSYNIVAHYGGDANFKPSTSSAKTLTVLRHPSVTTLTLSKSTITYGNEQVEKFSVKVSAGVAGIGVPTGYVVVKSGTKILCTIHLYLGKGTCSPAPKALAPGWYKIVAHYKGNTYFRPSTSSKVALHVKR